MPSRLLRQSALFWAGLGAVLGGGVMLAFLLLSPGLLGAEAPAEPQPELIVIAYPSDTPTPTATATASPTPEVTPTETPPQAGTFSVGELVQVQGTQGDGLRLRADAGLEGEIRFLALEAEVFEVQEGPVEADGYTWWFLVNPYDTSKRGWGVANYLRTAED